MKTIILTLMIVSFSYGAKTNTINNRFDLLIIKHNRVDTHCKGMVIMAKNSPFSVIFKQYGDRFKNIDNCLIYFDRLAQRSN